MSFVVALLLLGQLQGVGLSDEDGGEKVVRHLNCVGSGITCSSSSTYGTITVSGGGGGASVPAACTSGQCVTSNGSALVCTSTINATTATSATSATTATALASNPTDCSAGQYANAIAANGNLTCGTPAGVPGGSSAQLQYNNTGAFGGTSNVETDGTRLRILGETASPAAPSSAKTALHYDFVWDSGFPVVPTTIDSFMGLPMPVGMLSGFAGAPGANWWCQCAYAPGWGNGTQVVGVNTTAPSSYGSVASNTWSAATLMDRMRWVRVSISGSANSPGGYRDAKQTVWRGNTAGAGGWVSWQRFGYEAVDAGARTAVGFFAKTGALGPTVNPSVETDSVYIGCNQGDSNLSACSNDDAGTATCNSLGAAFPCNNLNLGGMVYDVFFAASPNSSSVSYRVDKVGSPATTSGLISSDLPANSSQMGWHTWVNNGAGGHSSFMAFMSACVCANP